MSAHRYNFNGGELCPELQVRPDLQKWQVGCRRVQNWELTRYGALTRRPGVQNLSYLGNLGGTGDTWETCRAFAFAASATDRYIVLLYVLADPDNDLDPRCDIVVYRVDTGAQVYTSMGDATPPLTYEAADLDEIDYANVNDVMYLAHRSYPLIRLERIAEDDWRASEATINGGPYMEERNSDWGIMTLSKPGTPYLLTVSSLGSPAPFEFTDAWIGTTIRLRETAGREVSAAWTTGTALNTTTSNLPAAGTVELVTAGTWTGKIAMEVSDDGGTTWETLGMWTAETANPQNFQATREIVGYDRLVRMRLAEALGGGSGTLRLSLTCVEDSFAYVQISAVTSTTVVEVERLDSRTDLFAANGWQEGHFGPKNGYPGTVQLWKERLWLGGSSRRPQSFFASRTNNWEDFVELDDDASSIWLTLAADQRNSLQWMTAGKQLLMGSDVSEYVTSARSNEGGISTTNVNVDRHSSYGSAKVKPVWAGSDLFYVQAGGKRLRHMRYAFESDQYASDDASLLGYHLTTSGITQLASSYDRVYCLTGNSTIAVYTFDSTQEIAGWSELTFAESATVMSMCSVPTTTGSAQLAMVMVVDDAAWLVLYDPEHDTYLDHTRTGPGNFNREWVIKTEFKSPLATVAWQGAAESTWALQMVVFVDLIEGAEDFRAILDSTEYPTYHRLLGGEATPWAVDATTSGHLLLVGVLAAVWDAGSVKDIEYYKDGVWASVSSFTRFDTTLSYPMFISDVAAATTPSFYYDAGCTSAILPSAVFALGDAYLVFTAGSAPYMKSAEATYGQISGTTTSTVSAGAYLADVTEGLYTSIATLTTINWGDGQLGKRARVSKLRLYVVNSAGGIVYAGPLNNERQQAILPEGSLVTQEVEVGLNSGYADNLVVAVAVNTDDAFTMAAIAIDIQRGET